MHLIVAPEAETRMNRTDRILKVLVAESSVELKKVTNPQIQEAKLVPSKVNKRKYTLKDSEFFSFGYISRSGIARPHESSIWK